MFNPIADDGHIVDSSEIFCYLGPKDIQSCKLVCRRWREFATATMGILIAVNSATYRAKGFQSIKRVVYLAATDAHLGQVPNIGALHSIQSIEIRATSPNGGKAYMANIAMFLSVNQKALKNTRLVAIDFLMAPIWLTIYFPNMTELKILNSYVDPFIDEDKYHSHRRRFHLRV
jgi:F-box-like